MINKNTELTYSEIESLRNEINEKVNMMNKSEFKHLFTYNEIIKEYESLTNKLFEILTESDAYDENNLYYEIRYELTNENIRIGEILSDEYIRILNHYIKVNYYQ